MSREQLIRYEGIVKRKNSMHDMHCQVILAMSIDIPQNCPKKKKDIPQNLFISHVSQQKFRCEAMTSNLKHLFNYKRTTNISIE